MERINLAQVSVKDGTIYWAIGRLGMSEFEELGSMEFSSVFYINFLCGLDAGSMLIPNVGTYLHVDTASQYWRPA